MSTVPDTMAPMAIDDDLRVEPAAAAVTGKRKRATAEPGDDCIKSEEHTAKKPAGLDKFLVDLFDLLIPYDTSPSILTHPITNISDDAPPAKRVKVAGDASQANTIQDKVAALAYQSINELGQDLATAIDAIATAETADGNTRQRSAKMRIVFEKLLARAEAQDAVGLFEDSADLPKQEQERDGIVLKRGDAQIRPLSSAISFAGPGGRPYFSSLRKESLQQRKAAADEDENSNKPLESVLPKGMWTSAVVPVSNPVEPTKRTKLGELCPKPSRLTELRPPREPHLATTRGASIGWYQPSPFPSSRMVVGGQKTYTNQKLSAGTWLHGNKTPSLPASTWSDRSKPKERPASVSEMVAEKSEQDHAVIRKAKRKFERDRNAAAFKSVYSSFAPSYDNTNSVVSQEQRTRLWWEKKYGAQSGFVRRDMATQGMDAFAPQTDQEALTAVDTEAIEDAIENFDEKVYSEARLDSLDEEDHTNASDKETGELLEEISEMLVTLSSYQRNRHRDLRARESAVNELGTASKPSSAEFSLHTVLRDQLAVLVSSLPPFALAKLDGERLKELNITTMLELEDDVHRGTLEDEVRSNPNPYQPNPPSSAGLRHPSISAARPNTYTTSTGSPASRNNYSAPRSSSTFYAGRPSASSNAGAYGTYPSPAPPRVAQHPPYNHQQHPQRPNGTRPGSTPNGYLSHGTPGPGRPLQYSTTTPQSMQHRRPIPPNPQFNHYNGPSPSSSAPRHQTHQPAGGAAAYANSIQLSPSRPTGAYATYTPPTTSGQRVALSNGIGTIGSQIQMSEEERALIASRQRQHAQAQAQVQTGQQSYHGMSKAQPPSSAQYDASAAGHLRPTSSSGAEVEKEIVLDRTA